MAVVAGIDWASETHVCCVIDDAGGVVERFDVAHDASSLRVMTKRLVRLGVSGVAIERGDGPVVEVLMDAEIPVFVVPSRQVKGLRSRYGSAGNKDDRFDAYVLADTLRTAVTAGPDCVKTARTPRRFGRRRHQPGRHARRPDLGRFRGPSRRHQHGSPLRRHRRLRRRRPAAGRQERDHGRVLDEVERLQQRRRPGNGVHAQLQRQPGRLPGRPQQQLRQLRRRPRPEAPRATSPSSPAPRPAPGTTTPSSSTPRHRPQNR